MIERFLEKLLNKITKDNALILAGILIAFYFWLFFGSDHEDDLMVTKIIKIVLSLGLPIFVAILIDKGESKRKG